MPPFTPPGFPPFERRASSPAPPAAIEVARPQASIGRPIDPNPFVQTQEQHDRETAYKASGASTNTNRAYASDWRHYEAWCMANGTKPLSSSPKAIAQYLYDCAAGACGVAFSNSTLIRRISAICKAHDALGLTSPTRTEVVKSALKNIKRTHIYKVKKESPITLDILEKLLSVIEENTLRGLRDRALILVGFAGAFRRSEYTRLKLSQLKQLKDGSIVINLGKTKTDQTGELQERVVIVPNTINALLCPVTAISKWLVAANIHEGHLFRKFNGQRCEVISEKAPTPQIVWRLIKKYCPAAGLDPQLYGAHSLRAGFITQAARQKAQLQEIMQQSRHRNANTVIGYIREDDPLKGNAAAGIWGKK
jgi:site-specific recombinase XerD